MKLPLYILLLHRVSKHTALNFAISPKVQESTVSSSFRSCAIGIGHRKPPPIKLIPPSRLAKQRVMRARALPPSQLLSIKLARARERERERKNSLPNTFSLLLPIYMRSSRFKRHDPLCEHVLKSSVEVENASDAA